MSDFFASLAGRLEGTVPVLRPRLPSLFENAAGGERPDHDAAPNLVTEGREREAVPAPPQRREPGRPPAEPPPLAREERAVEPPRRKEPGRGVVREESADALEPPVSTPGQTRRAIRRDMPDAPPAEPPRNAARQAPHALQSAPPRVEPPLPQQSRVDRRAAEPRGERLVAPPPPQVRATVGQPAALVPLPHAAPVPPPFALQPPVLPRSARQIAREQMRPVPLRESQEPAIHVSIGRIEIRAETQGAPRRKTAETSPVMSLDEYLRSRAK